MAPFTVQGLTSVINQLLPEPHAGLLAGLLFGTQSSLSREFYDALVTTGTLHIIALSGMNITIMTSLIGATMRPILGVRNAGLVTIGVICWFVWFVGAEASIVRAAIMGSISLVSMLVGRQYWGVLSWIIASGLMVIVKPEWLTSVSFQLSILSSLGLILFGGTERKTGDKVVSHIIGFIRNDLRLTFAAQVFTVPLVFFTFRRISLISPIANVAIGWVIAPLTTLGWVTVLSGWLVLYAGQMLAWVDWLLLEYLVRTVFLLRLVPFAGLSF